MMNKLKLAVISDIHVGAAARSKDLCPTNTPGRDDKPDDKYRDKFLDFLSRKKLTADYLILPGDVTNRAKPDEAQIASEFIEQARQGLGVQPDNVVFVPGNHDVDWTVLDTEDSTGVRHAQRYDPLKAKQFCFSGIVARGSGSVFEAPHFTIWNTPKLLVIGYNSSHHDAPKKFHHGLIDANDIHPMREAMSNFATDKDQVRLFLVHHHPLQYDDPTPTLPDTSIMINSEQLQNFLREFQFDILIHGHRHLPRFTTHSVNGSPEVAILCSGSFSVQIDTRWVGTISNQFHLVTVDDRDAEEHLIMGRIDSWSYNYARGWAESDAIHDGIPHIEPFGTYIRPEKLKSLLSPIILAGFKKTAYIEWSSILENEPKLRHLRPEIIVRVLDDLSNSIGFRRFHDLPEKMILLK